jgi:conjugative transfer signal peptidase TraF
MIRWLRRAESPAHSRAKRAPRRLPGLSWCLCGTLALLCGAWVAGLRLNLTGSMPVGIYSTARDAPDRGSIVLACLPSDVATFAKLRGYVPRGGSCPGGVLPVGKPIVALAGDTVVVTTTGLLVNGIPAPNSEPLSRDTKGRPLPRPQPGQYVVGADELWLVSEYSRFSFDSRYFGPVDADQVRGHVRMLWTAGTSP